MSVIRCTIPGCICTFRRKGHLTLHMNSTHSNHHRAPPPTPFNEPSPAPTSPQSPQSNFSIPPNEDPPFGMDMPPRSPSPSVPKAEKRLNMNNTWAPFEGEAKFRIANLLFRKEEMSQSHTDELLDIWLLYQRQLAQQAQADSETPESWGSAPWKCFQTVVDDDLPLNAPEWQKSFVSGLTQIYDQDETGTVDGAMLIPVILGANKTTVSVATGHVEYHPLYLTISNLTNALRHAHSTHVFPLHS
ncbi:hypothetical protein BT96DRAFT_1006910 [Gymnopus androsaceus JB14]|uniref:C2H2-type domain-containing protein n=1 Tax=Gymnopus androsaceus JB14 TaxID=1447944 RepID=A0A6A4GJ91_9AGAR|nr:hypothetical protein BT96DRAFT_1006910 [Gymnopus androsaceus JB14]